MEAIINKIKDILEDKYSNKNFVTLVKEIFPEMQLVAPDKFNEEYSNFSSYVEGYTHISNYITPDNKKILILAIQLKNAQYVENSRSAQRNFAKRLIENNRCDAAFIAFYTKPSAKIDEGEAVSEKDNKWRISFVKMDYSINFDSGKMKTNKNLTPAKRYSYLVGKGEPSHTAIERIKELIEKKNNITIDDIENAFSVEKVTDEFFEAYTEKFNDLNDYLRNNDDFKHEALRLELNPEEFSVQFSKKLLGQIVFLYFLQKKGWLGVNAWPSVITEKEFKHAYYDFDKFLTRKYIPRLYIKDTSEQDLYRLNTKEFKNIPPNDESYLAKTVKESAWGTGPRDFMRKYYEYAIKQDNNKNFYDDYLEPLFYDALNNNRGEEGYWPYFHCRIPFLSGSLFEPINNYDWQHSKFNIPNEMFSNKKSSNDLNGNGIFDIFDRYNFTISEDEPMEKEVAIDPEMLGKVFENMLEVKDRKSKGAYYTPREIVHYMCQESLINYLTNNTGISYDAIRDFILYGEYIKSEDTNKNNNEDLLISREIYQEDSNGKILLSRFKEIDDLLADIKVADPAVGSGAFPLGMLNEIVRARTTITDYMYKYENAYNKRLIYTSERSVHKLKVETIKNSIFAVDIEPSAVDIAKLRLWLSLVIDDEINPKAQNELEGHKNPLPLPNLECNILCGNSLIDEIDGHRLIESSAIIGTDEDVSFSTSTFNILLDQLLKAEDKLFACSNTDEKLSLKREIEDIKFEIIKMQIVSNGGASEEVLKKITETRNMSSKPYIVWQLDFAKVFRDKKGFDIVIGNPPYVGEKGNKKTFRDIKITSFGTKYYERKMDLFYFFFHKGIDIANNNSTILFITTNYYPTATGGINLRKDLKERTSIIRLINFNELKIFESAKGQHNLITILEKSDNIKKCIVTDCKEKGFVRGSELNRILNMNDNNIILSQDELFEPNDMMYLRLLGNKSEIEENTIDSILNKIQKNNPLLSNLCNINQGLRTGADKVKNSHIIKYNLDNDGIKKDEGIFILPNEQIESLNLTEKERQKIKPLFKNSDIKKFYSENRSKYSLIDIFYPNDRDIDMEEYPNIYKHLQKYKKILEGRSENANGIDKAIARGEYWYASVRRKINFDVEKIICPQRNKYNIFGYNSIPWYASADVYFITQKDKDINLKYILGLLNSKLYYIWLYYRGKRKGDNLELYEQPLSEIPIKMADIETENKIIEIVNQIMRYKNQNIDTKELEKQLDIILYKLFNLTDEEINIVEECYNG